jgi:signal peptidase I
VNKKIIPNDEMMNLIREALKINQKATFKVSGNSMLPFFKHQETTVTVEKMTRSLKKWDVILFRVKDQYILHRIVKIKNQEIICQGDYLFSKEVIKLDDVIGIVESFETKGKVIDVNQKRYLIKVKLWRLIKPIYVRLKRIFR